jgi:hypothetical protein
MVLSMLRPLSSAHMEAPLPKYAYRGIRYDSAPVVETLRLGLKDVDLIEGITSRRDLMQNVWSCCNQFAPRARAIGLLINPTDPASEDRSREGTAAAPKFALQLETRTASTDAELEPAFAALAERRFLASLSRMMRSSTAERKD